MVNKSTLKKVEELPEDVKKKLYYLITDLGTSGPIQRGWKNFSKLGGNKYHCHLTYRYVACWSWKKKSILIEVYYAGSREKAPY